MAHERVRFLAFTASLAALTAVCSLIAIPNPLLPAVPFTLQIFAVCLTGALLPPGWAFAAQFVYLLLGAMGLPVFAGGASGPAVLFSVTGGYLWGYPLAAAVIAASRGQHPSWWRDVAASCLGIVVVYGSGVVGIRVFGRVHLTAATVLGVLSFLPWDLAKGVIAVAVATRVRAALRWRTT